jgi:hypothetical protein
VLSRRDLGPEERAHPGDLIGNRLERMRPAVLDEL